MASSFHWSKDDILNMPLDEVYEYQHLSFLMNGMTVKKRLGTEEKNELLNLI